MSRLTNHDHEEIWRAALTEWHGGDDLQTIITTLTEARLQLFHEPETPEEKIIRKAAADLKQLGK